MYSSHAAHQFARTRTGSRAEGGFTLVEVLTTVLIIGILMAIAMPQYQEYVRTSTVVEGETALADYRVKMEQYYLDNRNYGSGGTCGVPYPSSSQVKYFSVHCFLDEALNTGTGAHAAAGTGNGQKYVVSATGNLGAASGHTYWIDEGNNKYTTLFKSNAVSPAANCWLVKGASC